MVRIDINQVNIASREHKSDPYPFYSRLRSTHPVFPVELPDRRTIWLVTRYEDVVEVLKDERFVKDPANVAPGFAATKQPWLPGFAKPLLHHMLNKDKPDHPRLRGLVNKAFSPQIIKLIAARIQSVSSQLLQQLDKKPAVDLIADYALPIPSTIIAEMLGVPEQDRARFVRWSNAIMQVNTTRWGIVRAVPNVWAFVRFIRKLIRRCQSSPSDDLTSALVQAEIEGERLTDDELVAMIFLLMVAGHETTVNLIGNGLLALIQHSEQKQLLLDEPTLMGSAIEEMLRFDSPVEMGTERYAREDLTIAGVTIPGGSLVGVVLASANRDEQQFENPNELNLARTPNRHLAFGLGAHYCTGAPLARLEGRIAISAMLEKFPAIRLASVPEDLIWRPGLVTRGLEHLPVILGS